MEAWVVAVGRMDPRDKQWNLAPTTRTEDQAIMDKASLTHQQRTI